MKKKFIIILTLVLTLILSSCLTSKFGYKDYGIHTNLVKKDYEVLGTVSMKSTINNILWLVSYGGKGYSDLLAEAKSLYPEADAVIDIAEDVHTKYYFGFFNQITREYTGTVIKYLESEPKQIPETTNEVTDNSLNNKAEQTNTVEEIKKDEINE